MKRLPVSLLAVLGLTACAVNLGGSGDIDLTAVALRASAGASVADVSAALRAARADVALVTASGDSAWFAAVAGATGRTLSGPAGAGDLALAFLATEPVGDTTVVLSYTGGSITVHDALYRMRRERFLDLMAFRIDAPAEARPAVGALLRYMATEVMNSAAVIMAVTVPSAAVGDSVARMLSPAYFDALRCEPGVAPEEYRSGVRLFYGPEARVYCRAAAVEGPAVGHLVRADLVLGRR